MSTPLQEALVLLPPPIVDALLDDIDGGQPNLLHIDDLQVPLAVEIPEWLHSDPSPDHPESLELFWNEKTVATRFWTTPILPEDLHLTVATEFLTEGQQRMEYKVVLYNGSPQGSQPLIITIDTSPPILGGEQGALVFPTEVIDGGLTWQYLEACNDRVVAQVPEYREVRPGDTLTWYWDDEPFAYHQAGSRTLTSEDTGKPLELVFDGNLIRERGDGRRYVHYDVTDRAGNPSVSSRQVPLTVSATPIPRELLWLDVVEADGVGEELVLDPEKGRSGIQAVLDAQVLIHPDEEVWVLWDDPGSVADFEGLLDKDGDPRLCRIPKESVIASIGKTVTLYYEVRGPGEVLPSTPRHVRVSKVSSGFPTVQCEGQTSNGLSLAGVPASGARLTLAFWKLMTTDQMVRILVSGVNPAGETLVHRALYDHRVTEAELVSGIGAEGDVVITKAFLESLKIGEVLSVKVYVSFDLGETWPYEAAPNFPSLRLTLIP